MQRSQWCELLFTMRMTLRKAPITMAEWLIVLGGCAFIAVFGRIRILASRHPLAAFFSSLDVRGDNRAEPGWQSLGIFHRRFSGRPVGFHQRRGDHVFSQRSRSARAVA